ncbi:MAG TPA: pyruvate dehydrogenase (acetyl-transferring) E1 component subunit alpha, partial [Spirochaetes bacterium]|nr:pyruvate dehydrogenase (acetyl-transferring) E1 component subunit alpha [Spirochaetota bacterium]
MSVVATFEIGYLRILDEEGHLLETIPDFARDPKTLLTLYRYMILTRRFDAKAVALQRTG